MSRRRSVSALIALLASGAMTVTAAAESPLEPPELAEYVRWGPLRARPNIGIRNLGKDDNVFFATGPEEPESDYRMTLGGRLEGLVLFGDRAFLTFDERLNYTAYKKFDDQNYVNQYLTSRATFPFSGWGVFGDFDYVWTETRPTTEFNTRVRQRVKRLGAGFIVELGWRTYLEFERERSDWKIDERDRPATAEKLDRLERANVLRVNYRLTGMTRLTLDGWHTKYDFDTDFNRDSTQVSLLPGFTFGEGSRLRGSVKFGYTEFDMKDPGQDDFDTSIGEADLVYRIGGGTTLRLEGGREVGFAVVGENTFYVNRYVGGRVTHYFNAIIGGTVAGELGELSFPQEMPFRIDDNTFYELGVLFRSMRTRGGKTVEYGLNWRRTRRDSTLDDPDLERLLDQSRSVWGFTATAGF